MIPIRNNQKIKNESDGIEPLTPIEFKELYKDSDSFYQLIYLIGAGMGLREREISFIDVQDINKINQTLSYAPQKKQFYEITEKPIPKFIYDRILKHIEKHNLKPSDALFKIIDGRYKGNRISPKTISKKTKERYIKLGIGQERKKRKVRSKKNPIKKASLHNKNFHSLRHLYGTQLYNIVKSDIITAHSLRHSKNNLETVKKHYIHAHNLKRESHLQEQLINKLKIGT